MSRIGKLPITVPSGVDVSVDDSGLVTDTDPDGGMAPDSQEAESGTLRVVGYGGIGTGVVLLTGLGAFIRRATTELAVTDHRVIYKTGLLSRHTIEMNRDKVESVDVDQTVAGRIFGYGTIVVRGTGGSLEPIRNIADPLTFRSYITAGPSTGQARG